MRSLDARNFPFPLVRTDQGGHLLEGNSAWEQLMIDLGSMAGASSWLGIVAPLDASSILQAWEQSRSKGETIFRARCHGRANGIGQVHRLAVWAEDNGKNNNSYLWLVETLDHVENTNERRRDDKSAELFELRFRSILDNGILPTMLFDAQGVATKVNKAWLDLWGVSEEESATNVIGKYNITKDQAMDDPELGPAIRQAFAGNAASTGPVLHDPQRTGHPGRKRWIETSFTPVRHLDGAVIEVIMVYRDVTEKIENEKAFVAQKQEMEAILDHSPAVIYVKGPDGKLLFINRKYEQLFGIDRTEAIGKTDLEVFPEAYAVEYRQNDLRVQQLGQPIRYEETAPHADGTHHYLSIKFPIFGVDGELRAVCGISTDITDQKVSEKERAEALVREKSALEASALKSQFLATVSHEIRTPINGVLGMATLLADTSLDETQKSYLEAIESSTQNLMVIVNDVLDFSKIEAGKLEIEKIPFSLASVVRGVSQTLSVSANAKNLSFHFHTEVGLPNELVGDPGRIRQILINLIGNAIKFTSTGSVKVGLRHETGQDDRTWIRFEVKDTGIGLSSAQIANLFQAFTQADATMSRKFGGTGLGLSICKHLANLMGGEIGVESTLNAGACFWVRLPFDRAEAASESAQGSEVPAPSLSLAGVRILLAEDNVVNQRVAVAILEKEGAHIEVAENGIEALRALRLEAFDLVLMDCQMPQMDGYEATMKIREGAELPARTRAIPIVALTANALAGERDICLGKGMNDYLTKPVRPNDLIQTILRNLAAAR